MPDSLTVANRFLDLARDDGCELTPMQLLKLVYIAHGWRLGLYHRALINDEVQAWQYGPVIPRLYNAVRNFRSNAIVGRLHAPINDRLNRNDQSVVDQTYAIYGHQTGQALSRLTHAPGTPWARTYRDGSFGIRIPNELIEGHYERLAQRGGGVTRNVG